MTVKEQMEEIWREVSCIDPINKAIWTIRNNNVFYTRPDDGDEKRN